MKRLKQNFKKVNVLPTIKESMEKRLKSVKVIQKM